MDIQVLYTEAAQLLENGLTKDAYIKFVNAVELSTQQLYGVKFVHQTIVSTPADYDKLLSTMRSSLTQLEHIVNQTTSFINKSSAPPPLPPKPVVPPKPKSSVSKRPVPQPPALAIVTSNFPSTTRSATTQHSSSAKCLAESPPPIQEGPIAAHEGMTIMTPKRSRANSSVTFADRRHTIPYMDDEEEEDDEEESIMNALKSTGTEKPSYPLPLPQRRLQSQQIDRSSAPSPPSPSTTSFTNSINTADDGSYLVIDPYDLVPAQTNTGESMALPISPTCTTDFYVPNIPAPPLLGMHRELQQQLDSLVAAQQQQQQQQTPNRIEQEQCSAAIATVRRLLNNVRTVYMSAMTVPTLLAFSPQLMAYQLTLIESAIFRAIPPEALQQHRAIAKQPHPNIVASTDFFNYLTRSIEHGILLPQEASHRAEVVHRWIKIATQCLALNNYQTLKAIVSALGTPPIQRLKRTWECIPKKRMNRLEVLTALMSEADNYSRYRQHIRTLVPNLHRQFHQPIVPFLGVLIHDMTYVLTAKSTTADDPRAIDILNWVRTFQRSPPYSLRPPPHYIKKKNGFFSRQAQALQHYYTPLKTPSSPSGPALETSTQQSSSSSSSNYFTTTNSSTTTSSIQRTLSSPSMTTTTSNCLSSDTSMTTAATAATAAAALADVDSVAVEQQRITHYLLMRPWVNEKIIDELSQLREAPRRPVTTNTNATTTNTTNVGHALARTNSCNSALNYYHHHSQHQHPDSMLSMSSGGGRSTWDNDDFPKSPSISSLYASSDEQQHPTLRRSLGSFWPWRKSGGDLGKHGQDDLDLDEDGATLVAVDTVDHQQQHQHHLPKSVIKLTSSSPLAITTITNNTTTPPPTPRRANPSSLAFSHHHRSASVPGATLS